MLCVASVAGIGLIDNNLQWLPLWKHIHLLYILCLFFCDVNAMVPFIELGSNAIVDYCYVWKRISTWIFCSKKTLVLWLCCWFGMISAMGLGLSLAMLLVVVIRSTCYLKRAMNYQSFFICHFSRRGLWRFM